MKDAYEVLNQKEADVIRVRQEVDSLKIVASLLDETGSDEPASDMPLPGDPRQSSDDAGHNSDDPNRKPPTPSEKEMAAGAGSQATGTEGPFTIGYRRGFWSAFKPRK